MDLIPILMINSQVIAEEIPMIREAIPEDTREEVLILATFVLPLFVPIVVANAWAEI